jgi:Protein of unknown function (DUF1194)
MVHAILGIRALQRLGWRTDFYVLMDHARTLDHCRPAPNPEAQALIEGNQIEGHRKVIDVSADSANNWGGLSIAAVLSRWR